jgi:hypothetical protein
VSDERTPCWLVWKAATDGGRPYLVAICTKESIAKRYVRCVYEEAKVLDKPKPHVLVEPSFLDHLYGESMGQGIDQLRAMFKEIKAKETP